MNAHQPFPTLNQFRRAYRAQQRMLSSNVKLAAALRKRFKRGWRNHYRKQAGTSPAWALAILHQEASYSASLRKVTAAEWHDRVMAMDGATAALRAAVGCVVWWDFIGNKIANAPISKDPFYGWLCSPGGAGGVAASELCAALRALGYSEHMADSRVSDDENEGQILRGQRIQEKGQHDEQDQEAKTGGEDQRGHGEEV